MLTSSPAIAETPSDTSDADARRRRSTRIKAILAGGLVLGLGAAVTLAAWTDSEFAQGEFAAGTFNLEGSIDQAAFSEHATAAAPAELDFTLQASNLAPDDVVYAPYAVRLDDTTTYDADVLLTHEATTGVVSDITYSVIQSTTAGCDATTTGDDLVTDQALGTVPASTTFELSKGATGVAGDPAYLCFIVNAGDLTAGQSGTVTWEFAATSKP